MLLDFLLFSRNDYVLQLLENFEASASVFLCTVPLEVVAARAGVEVTAEVIQPVLVATVHVLEAHYISVLHWSTINSVPRKDLESDPTVEKPGVSIHRTGCSVSGKNYIRKFTRLS